MEQMKLAMVQIMIEVGDRAILIQMEAGNGLNSGEVLEMDMNDESSELLGGFSIEPLRKKALKGIVTDLCAKAIEVLEIKEGRR